jgi:NADP-dependent 3-hydroxy acid dehydrogenase YdfG
MKNETKPVVLVTGASSGLGKDFALLLLSAGYAVYGAARRMDRMRDIEDAGGVAIGMDMTDDASMISTLDRVFRERGRIDVLINNAGYGLMGALEDIPIEEGRRQLEVNLIGVARLTQLCPPQMRGRKSGKIVNISSIGGKFSSPLGGWYHASRRQCGQTSRCDRNRNRRMRSGLSQLYTRHHCSLWEAEGLTTRRCHQRRGRSRRDRL